MSRPRFSSSASGRSPTSASAILYSRADANADQPTVMITRFELGDELSGHIDAGHHHDARPRDQIEDTGAAQSRAGQQSDGKDAEDAGHAVHAKHVERVVVLEAVLEAGGEPVADAAGGEAERDRAHWTGVPGCGRDGDQSRQRARD